MTFMELTSAGHRQLFGKRLPLTARFTKSPRNGILNGEVKFRLSLTSQEARSFGTGTGSIPA